MMQIRMQQRALDDQHAASAAAATDFNNRIMTQDMGMHRSRPVRDYHHSAHAAAAASVFAEERTGSERAAKQTTAKNSSGKNGHRHTKRSPSERRFKCEQVGCERMFFTRKDVKRHMVVHTGVRNFPCQYCQQRFGRKDHLVRHAKKSHNRDCRSSASSYAMAAAAPATFNPQSSALAAAHSHVSKMSRHVNPALLPINSVPSAPAACCSNGQSSPSSQMLLLSGRSYSSSCPVSVQSVGSGSEFASHSSALMQQPQPQPQHSQHQHVTDVLSHHSLSGSHSQSHITVSPVPHPMAKSSSFDGNGYHFLPVPSAGHFVSHSLMSPFVANSSARSLYTTPGHFSAMSGMTVDPHHPHHPHHHHSGPPPPGIPFPGDNSGLPHFNQAFH